ncbi:MAG: hypothetical protein C0481_04220 [Phenylobacterium sp.]|uniref:hypothetical protein n=1 Tax=Phenylobacterium sp. TaxID=1871053 RepID=UPI0025D56F51|nr:hypothetical protein [Phenylobacterium sp.]MBA4011051.1 hypothetical protein [Phenylobacterium sp.]
MRFVALIAALGLIAAGTASAQSSGQVRHDVKSSGLLMAATYKTAPARTTTDNTVRFTAKPASAAKPQLYIYKAPMAVKPLKTW